MKKLFVILVFTGIVLQTFYSGIIYVNYQINKEYITKVFCENKSKPMLHCNGKCHLMKQMKEAEKKQNNPLNNLKEKLEVQFCSLSAKPNYFNIVAGIQANFYYFFSISSSSPDPVFHPPQA